MEKINSGKFKEKVEKKNQKEEPAVMSKGGALDVGQHSGTTCPNTSMEIIKSLLVFFSFDQGLVDLILIDVKIEVLLSYIKSVQDLGRDIEHIFKCVTSAGHSIMMSNQSRF